MSGLDKSRITPLPAEEWDRRVEAALGPYLPAGQSNPSDAGNLLSTLARHPDLAESYLPFNACLLRDSRLSPRVQHVAILRVSHLCASSYLWSRHVQAAHYAGVTVEDIDDIRSGYCADDKDDTVVCAVDDLTSSNTIRKATWTRLLRYFSDEERADLCATIAGYFPFAMIVNTLRIDDEST